SQRPFLSSLQARASQLAPSPPCGRGAGPWDRPPCSTGPRRRMQAPGAAKRGAARPPGGDPGRRFSRPDLALRAALRACRRRRETVSSGAMEGDVTRVLDAAARGDPRAAERLLPLVYRELRRLAARKLAQ